MLRGSWDCQSAASTLSESSSAQNSKQIQNHNPNFKNPNSRSKLMASSKLMPSSDPPSSPSPKPHFTTTNFLDDQISLADAVATPRTVDDVWREIVAGDVISGDRECKEEISDEMMTLEDFLVKAGAVEDEEEGEDVKLTIPSSETLSGSGMFSLDSSFQGIDNVDGSVIGFGNGNGNGNGNVNGVEMVEGGGRGKRGRPVMEQLDKAAQQRQRRMIKNRESAARSRERKQVLIVFVSDML